MEQMEVLAQCGLSALVALLQRSPGPPASAISIDAAGQPTVPAGASGVLLAPALRDLLATGQRKLELPTLHEPWMLAPALAEYARRSGQAVCLRWAGSTGSGACVAVGGPRGPLHLHGWRSESPASWSCRLQFLDQPAEPLADLTVAADEEAELLAAARRSGLTVRTTDWEAAVAAARDFLVGDQP
ncbi:hypothetical protein [Geodermatophilus chilensis]|uniref:hypothetical protein n=1 Tax=Geodermatophilus chilensis TaxID=2035835 RepID=UPI000C265D4D|nr:hypothetical protein [Geodermatophilus chilensis]